MSRSTKRVVRVRDVLPLFGPNSALADADQEQAVQLYDDDCEWRVLWRERQGGGDSVVLTDEQKKRLFG